MSSGPLWNSPLAHAIGQINVLDATNLVRRALTALSQRLHFVETYGTTAMARPHEMSRAKGGTITGAQLHAFAPTWCHSLRYAPTAALTRLSQRRCDQMKRPGDKSPDPPGGRALERLRQFEDARLPPAEREERERGETRAQDAEKPARSRKKKTKSKRREGKG